MSDAFDLGEWLDSVEGRTVRVTAPRQLGPRARSCLASPAPEPENDSYCEECDEFVRYVETSPDETVGHCPLCGRTPSMLELGTRRVDPWERGES